MNIVVTSDIKLYSCQLCTAEYNLVDRPAKDLGCGHSICLPCLKKVASKTSYKCNACGQDRFFTKGVDKTPTNVPLMKIVEARGQQKKEICSEHVKYFKDCVCLDHKCQICLYCVVYGDHKGHRTCSIEEVDIQVEKKVKNFEDQLQDFEVSSKDVTSYLKKDKEELVKRVHDTFETLSRVLASQREEVLRDVDQVYKHRATKKLKTQCFSMNLDLADTMEKTIVDLRSEEFNDSFFTALESDEIKMPLTPLKEEFSLLKAECQDLGTYLAEDLGQHCKKILEKIMEVKPIKIDFEPTSPLKDLLPEAEPAKEPEPMQEEVQNAPAAQPAQQAQSSQPAPAQPTQSTQQGQSLPKESSQKVVPQEATGQKPQAAPVQKSPVQKAPSLPLADTTNSQNAPTQRRRVKIHVQTPKRYLEIEADVNDTIKKIKDTLERNEGISSKMDLVYQKRVLDESMTIGSCDIKSESTLYFGAKDWIAGLRP